MKKSTSGFTIVELLVVIAVIGILATIGVVGFSRYQINARDSERSSKATILVEALEKFYDNNGEYPSCKAISGPANDVITTVLPGVALDTLVAPKTAPSISNSITCASLMGNADGFAYIGDGSSACSSGNACIEWTLEYTNESTGKTIKTTSRRNTKIATSGSITSLVATGTSETTIGLLWNPVDNAANYTVQRAGNSTFTTDVLSSTVADAGTSIGGLSVGKLYYFRVLPNAPSSAGEWSNNVNTATLVNAPSAPQITSVLSASTITGSISIGSVCSTGANIRYGFSESHSTTNTDGANSSWTSWTSALSQQITTSASQGAKYKVKAQARCEGPDIQSSATSSSNTVSVIVPFSTPGALTVASAANGLSDSNTWSWTSTCPTDTTAQYKTVWSRDDATGWRAWDADSAAFATNSKSITTNYQGYSYALKAVVRCSSTFGGPTSWSAESNSASYLRDINTPANATSISTARQDFIDPGSGYQGSRSVYSWVEPSCGLGTTGTFNYSYYSYYTFGDGVGSSWMQAFNGFMGSNPQSLWRSANPMGSVSVNMNASFYTPMLSTGSSYSPPNVLNQKGTSLITGSTNPITREARVYIRYRCENGTTGRVSTPSPGIFSNLAVW